MFNENKDFYPTPNNLIRKMLSYIDFKRIRTVLEPSAGKGDLVEGIKKQFEISRYHSRKENYDIDLIENNENLQHILQGNKYRLVHDDFLTFNTYKRYDAIILNPPFSNGDKHALKAIEMQERSGGEIVCLLNADTLNNPYTNTRKDLLQQLEKYDADVEYIENAFMDAERSTGVEIALIYINIPKTENKSVILDELKQDEPQQKEKDYNSKELIYSDFIEGIVQQFNYEVKAGLKLIEEYNALKPLMLDSLKDEHNRPILKLELDREDRDGSTLENAYIKQIRLKYWKALFNNDQFMGLFTSNLKRKYMEHVEELKDYDFSLYNIYTLRIQLSQEMIQGVEDTILDLFEEFSHKHYYAESSSNIHLYNGWKTNKAYKINKKVIIPLDAFSGWSLKPFDPTRYGVMDKLKDIEKVFNYLDDGGTENIDIDQTLKMAEHYHDTKKIELKYFYVTFYKKGTCHIEFKDMRLLHKFNLFGSQRKGWLPPSYGKAQYKDMTKEEKETIDQFEGEKSYNKVMSNKSYFIMEKDELLKLTAG